MASKHRRIPHMPRAARVRNELAAMVINVVSLSYDVPPRRLAARRRGVARTALARQVAMYLLHCSCRLSLTDVGLLFRRDRTTVAHGCRRIEELREDPSFDWRLAGIERAVVVFGTTITRKETT